MSRRVRGCHVRVYRPRPRPAQAGRAGPRGGRGADPEGQGRHRRSVTAGRGRRPGAARAGPEAPMRTIDLPDTSTTHPEPRPSAGDRSRRIEFDVSGWAVVKLMAGLLLL